MAACGTCRCDTGGSVLRPRGATRARLMLCPFLWVLCTRGWSHNVINKFSVPCESVASRGPYVVPVKVVVVVVLVVVVVVLVLAWRREEPVWPVGGARVRYADWLRVYTTGTVNTRCRKRTEPTVSLTLSM